MDLLIQNSPQLKLAQHPHNPRTFSHDKQHRQLHAQAVSLLPNLPGRTQRLPPPGEKQIRKDKADGKAKPRRTKESDADHRGDVYE